MSWCSEICMHSCIMYLVRVDRENEAQMKWIRKQFNSYQGSESRVALSREGA